MGDYGLKIAQPGYDVGTVGLQQLAFSSKYPIFKIALSGNFLITLPAEADSNHPSLAYGTILHNLGYFPAFRCYSYTDSSKTARSLLDSNYNPYFLYARGGTQNIIFYGQNFGTTPGTFTIYYYIYADAGG